MSKRNAQPWAHALPSTLALMVPFDLLASLAMDVYLPVVAQMPAALATSTALIQLTLSAYILVLGVGQMLFGPLSDRIGRRPVVLAGAALFAGASFGLALANDGPTFLALRVVQALGAAAALVGTFATVRDVFADRAESATLYGLFSAILAFVPALGPILGALVAVAFGWRAIFWMLGLLAVLTLLHAWPRWPETRPEIQAPPSPAICAILGSRAFWVYTLGFSAAMGTFFVFLSIAPRLLIGRAGFGRIGFSLAFASVALVMIIATRSIGNWVATWGVPGCFVRGALVMAAGAIVLAVFTVVAEPGFIGFVVPMWLIAVGIVLLVAVTANGALRDFGASAGTAVAIYYCIQSLFTAILGTLSILALDGSSAWPLVAYCLVMATASLASLVALKPR